MELAAAAVLVLGVMLLIAWSNLNRQLRPPTTAPCDHPAFQPTVVPLGGSEYACRCVRLGCHDRAIITAASEHAARREYSAHPCAAQTGPFPPQ